jgi:hypothetical protein
MIRILLAALVAALAVPAAAQAPAMSVGSAKYEPSGAQKVAAAPRMRLEGTSSYRVELARPGADERAKLAALNRNGASLLARPGTPQFIGFGRDVAASQRRVDLASLAWTTLDGGARVARIEVASAGAAGLRVAVRMSQSHPDIQVRFAGASAAAAIASVPRTTIAQATARFGEYWSPVVDGERIAIEIEAEAGATLAGTALDVVRVSHLVVGPMATRRRRRRSCPTSATRARATSTGKCLGSRTA